MRNRFGWTFVIALIAGLAMMLAACGDDDTNEGTDTAGDVISDTGTDTGGVDTNTDPCAGIAQCAAAGIGCDGNTLVTCAADGNGCLIETSLDCTIGGGTCDDTATPAICAPAGCTDDAECDGAADGDSFCDGDDAISCAAAADGCLDATVETCAAGTCDDTGASAICDVGCTDDAACAAAADGDSFCTGDDAISCAAAADGCLDATVETCAAGTCDDTGATAICGGCTDDAACAAAADGDSFCTGDDAISCAAAADGCLDATVQTCAAGTCDDTGATAVCGGAGACADAVQVINCTNAGTTINGTTIGGTTVISGPCGQTDAYPDPEAIYEFVADADAQLTVDVNFDGAAVDLDIYALDGNEGVCSEALTCLTGSAGTSGTETMDLAVTTGDTVYILVDEWPGGSGGAFTLDITCDLPGVCGDGTVAFDEACDDGDADAGDGCSDTCEIEFGYDCDNTSGTSVCTAFPDQGTHAGGATITPITGGPLTPGASDLYTITFSENVLVSGTLTSTGGDADFFVFGPDGYVTGVADDLDETIGIALLAGTYVFVVNNWDGSGADATAYTLSLTTAALAVNDIGTFAATDTITDTTGGALTERTFDHHTITFSADVLLSGNLTGNTTGEMGIFVYDANMSLVNVVDIGADTFSSVAIAAGTYIIQIQTYSTALGGGNVDGYTLGLSVAAP